MLNSSITEQNFPLDYMEGTSMPYGIGSFLEENYWKPNIPKKIKGISEEIKKNVLEEIRANIFSVQISVPDDKEEDIPYVEELSEFDKVLNERIEKIYMNRRAILDMQKTIEEEYTRYSIYEDYEMKSGLAEIIECCEQIVNAYNESEDFLHELHSKIC